MRVENMCSVNDPARDLLTASLHEAGLVFYFLSPNYPRKEEYLKTIKAAYPAARLVGCTTGGEILSDEALENTAISSAFSFQDTKIKIAQSDIVGAEASFETGKRLGKELHTPDLKLIFILSDGIKVNGSELVRGIAENTHDRVVLAGGFAADGIVFKETGVGIDALPKTGVIAAVGFYGDKICASCGVSGGWSKFGPLRTITKSKGNALYEMDGKNALDLYKKYLGEEAKNLPASGLYFPLGISPSRDGANEVIRTFLAIDEKEQSLLFGGEMPEGYVATLMRGNTNSLVEGAACAARFAMEGRKGAPPGNAACLLVSCAGRRMLMNQNVSSEIEAVATVTGGMPLTGFYSHGEIGRHAKTGRCEFHNQTMAVTILWEAE